MNFFYSRSSQKPSYYLPILTMLLVYTALVLTQFAYAYAFTVSLSASMLVMGVMKLQSFFNAHAKLLTKEVAPYSNHEEKPKEESGPNRSHSPITRLYASFQQQNQNNAAKSSLPQEKLFTALMPDEVKEADSLRSNNNKTKKFFFHNGLPLTGKDFNTLRDGKMLNDEVINSYAKLINSRSSTDSTLPKTYMFNSFFYKSLVPKQDVFDYQRVRRWSRKAADVTPKPNLFEHDIVLYPIHVDDNHWVLGVINFKRKQFEIYDSLASSPIRSSTLLKNLRQYLEHEAQDKGVNLNLSQWKIHNPGQKAPQQDNGVDCGVFTLINAHLLGVGKVPSYSQKDIIQARQAITLQLARGCIDFQKKPTERAASKARRAIAL